MKNILTHARLSENAANFGNNVRQLMSSFHLPNFLSRSETERLVREKQRLGVLAVLGSA
jgi:hypothetical protein